MECWFIKGFFLFMIHIHFHVKMNFTNNPLPHSPRTHYSSIPVFQHSNWGVAPKFLRT